MYMNNRQMNGIWLCTENSDRFHNVLYIEDRKFHHIIKSEGQFTEHIGIFVVKKRSIEFITTAGKVLCYAFTYNKDFITIDEYC